MDTSLGARIAARIDGLRPATTRKEFAMRVGMKDDALSRALSGKRGFSSLELVEIAEALDADLHELLTGEPHPNLRIAARHHFDAETGVHSTPTRGDDTAILEQIRIAAVQAGPPPAAPPVLLPTNPAAMRAALGERFARPFADRIEANLGVGVVRVAELGTAYAGDFAGWTIIALPAVGSWFRENWDLAHELAHLSGASSEKAANDFAAELLLPATDLAAVDWPSAEPAQIAAFLWESGVSTRALRLRLTNLGLITPALVGSLDVVTQAYLRAAQGWPYRSGEEITGRMNVAGQRRFPLALQAAHERRIESGDIGPGYLAWMRGVDEHWVAEDYEPALAEVSADELAEALHLDLA